MLKKILLIIFAFCSVNVFSQLRSFDDIFPSAGDELRAKALSDSGYLKTSRKTNGFNIQGQQGTKLDPSIVNIVLRTNPGYIVESIMVIQGGVSYNEVSGTSALLYIYNALGNIRDLKGRLYNSATKNREVPLFEDATRIVSERQTTAIPDPQPSRTLPQTETVFIRLRDVNFGNTFYKGDMALVQTGLRYTLSNFRSMSVFGVPVIREGKFTAQLYFEQIHEGILLYSLAGADISDFVASQIHVDSAISKRLAVITSWAADGIRRN